MTITIKNTIKQGGYVTFVVHLSDKKTFRLPDTIIADNANDHELAKTAMLAFAKRIQDDPIGMAKQLAAIIFVDD